MLDWSPDTCDGLPEYQWTGLDGNVYYFNFSSGWVWRYESKHPGANLKEAQLTKALAALLNEYKEKYGLAENS